MAELGTKRDVVHKEEVTKKPLESNPHIRSGKKQEEASLDKGRQLEISTYFERASKHESGSHQIDYRAVIEANEPVSVFDEVDEVGHESEKDALPIGALKPEAQHIATAEDSLSRTIDKSEIKTKDNSAQTEISYNSIEVKVNQSHYQHSPALHPSLSQLADDNPSAEQQPSTSSILPQPSIPAPDPGDLALDQFTILDHVEHRPPEPQRQDLESLIEACNKLLPAPRPVRLAVPLPVDPIQLTDPPNITSQDVINAWTQSTLERTKEIWMYPVEDRNGQMRYVSGPPLKKRRVFNIFPEGFATTCPGGKRNVERMLETGVIPLIEGLPPVAGKVIGQTSMWQENEDIILPGERYILRTRDLIVDYLTIGTMYQHHMIHPCHSYIPSIPDISWNHLLKGFSTIRVIFVLKLLQWKRHTWMEFHQTLISTTSLLGLFLKTMKERKSKMRVMNALFLRILFMRRRDNLRLMIGNGGDSG